jgi:tetratricopeptide (TPR) repeat protein
VEDDETVSDGLNQSRLPVVSRSRDDLVGGLNLRTQAAEYAARFLDAAAAAEAAGGVDEAIALLQSAAERLAAAGPQLTEVSWLEYEIADHYQRRGSGERDDNRDAAIYLLERAVQRDAIESSPGLYAKVWGSLGDRYATRRRGDRVENQRRALAAYEAGLRLLPPMCPEKQWALNSHNRGLTLLELEEGDPLINAANALEAHWRAEDVIKNVDDDTLIDGRSLAGSTWQGCDKALNELAARLIASGSLSPLEVALTAPGPALTEEKARRERLSRMHAVLAVLATDLREPTSDAEIFRARKEWEAIVRWARDLDRRSLIGVARSHLGRLLLLQQRIEPGDRDRARNLLSDAALMIDPETHKWNWERNNRELAAA